MKSGPAVIVALFGSSGAAEISVFHAAVDGNGTNPLRLAYFPGSSRRKSVRRSTLSPQWLPRQTWLSPQSRLR